MNGAHQDEPPLLAFAQARLHLPDGTRIPETSASAGGKLVVLVGPFDGLFRLLTGEAELAGGSITILGTPAARAVANGVLGLALCDPPLPKVWTAERYLVESGLLLGWRARVAEQRAREHLAHFELKHLLGRTLGSLPLVERRALLIAHAALTDAPVVCLESPLYRLGESAAMYLESRIERALDQRRAILHVPSLACGPRERAFLDRADCVLLATQDHIVAMPPERVFAAGQRMLVTVSRRGDEFRRELELRGLTAAPIGQSASLLPAMAGKEGVTLERFLVVLAESSDTQGVLLASRSAQAPLLELRPLDLAV